jgi:D-3-phosphoglycerate dehydrogenase / 2-oxoglutarate reductase
MPAGKVLIPAFAGDPEVERMFVAAGFELDFALAEQERAHGRVAPDRIVARKEALAAALPGRLPQAVALNGMGLGEHLPITADMIGQADKLAVIFIGAAGYDRIDVEAATARGILVFNAPGGNADVVAEHALGLMLALSRRISDVDRHLHTRKTWIARQQIQATRPALGMLKGRTLGLVGFGFVGRHLAQRALAGLGMKIIAHDPFFDALEADRLGVRLTDTLNELLAEADVVSLHTPLTPKTRHLIDANALARMKKTALLINTSRGEVLETDSLVDALRNGVIAGAGLDVTEPEPLPDGHPLFEIDNAIVTPHIAGTAPETFARSAIIAASLALQALRGEKPMHIVNPAAWARHLQRFHGKK